MVSPHALSSAGTHSTGQLTNNFTNQAGTMTLNGVPNDVVNNLDPFALILFIPICDSFLYPGLRKMGVRFTAIRKVTMASGWLPQP